MTYCEMRILVNNSNVTNFIKVMGFSMVPTLSINDKLIIKKQDRYELGDILVYTYGDNIVVHRLLKTNGKLYLCKGDNSFRLEEILYHQILGKVIIIKRKNKIFRPTLIPYKFIDLSLKVYKEFIKNQFDVILTTKSDIYREYISIRSELCKK